MVEIINISEPEPEKQPENEILEYNMPLTDEDYDKLAKALNPPKKQIDISFVIDGSDYDTDKLKTDLMSIVAFQKIAPIYKGNRLICETIGFNRDVEDFQNLGLDNLFYMKEGNLSTKNAHNVSRGVFIFLVRKNALFNEFDLAHMIANLFNKIENSTDDDENPTRSWLFENNIMLVTRTPDLKNNITGFF